MSVCCAKAGRQIKNIRPQNIKRLIDLILHLSRSFDIENGFALQKRLEVQMTTSRRDLPIPWQTSEPFPYGSTSPRVCLRDNQLCQRILLHSHWTGFEHSFRLQQSNIGRCWNRRSYGLCCSRRSDCTPKPSPAR